LKGATLEAIAAGERTGDLGGKLGTREFTAAVIRRLTSRVKS
jgi:isocitrate/isopropylmalate dehydrogenase